MHQRLKALKNIAGSTHVFLTCETSQPKHHGEDERLGQVLNFWSWFLKKMQTKLGMAQVIGL
jgi:hypothetical protein